MHLGTSLIAIGLAAAVTVAAGFVVASNDPLNITCKQVTKDPSGAGQRGVDAIYSSLSPVEQSSNPIEMIHVEVIQLCIDKGKKATMRDLKEAMDTQ